MLRRFSVNFAVFSMILDGLAVALGLWYARLFRPVMNGLPGVEYLPGPAPVPGALYVLFPLTWLLIHLAVSIYDGKKYLRVVDEFGALSLAMLVASVSAAGILYLSFREVSRALFVLFVVLTYCFELAWRVLARFYFRSRTKSAEGARKVLVVGKGPLGEHIRKQIESMSGARLKLVSGGAASTEEAAQLPEVIRAQQVSDVVIAMPYSAYNQLGELVQAMEELPVRVWVALGFMDLALYKMGIEDFAGVPMLDLRASALDDYQRLLKRAFDLLVGGVALILSLPLMAVCALAILVEDGAPVIFRQKRAGENGRVFEMYKFRTMVRNAEELRAQVERSDENGNLLHKTRGGTADPQQFEVPTTGLGPVLKSAIRGDPPRPGDGPHDRDGALGAADRSP